MDKDIKAQELKELQAKIQKINTERTRQEGKRDSVVRNLKEKVLEYMETYGVSMPINSIEDVKIFAENESKKVNSEQKKELAQKKKLVELYDNRNVQGMRELLGLEPEVVDFVIEAKPKSKDTTDKVEKPSKSPEVVKPKPIVVEDEEDDFTLDDDFSLDDADDVKPTKEVKKVEETVDTDDIEDDFMLDDLDDEDWF